MFIHQMTASKTSLEISSLSVGQNLLVPIRQHVSCKVGCQPDHSNSKIGIIDIEIVRKTPSNKKVNRLRLQFPGNDTWTPSEAFLTIIHTYDDFSMAWKDLTFMIFYKKIKSNIKDESSCK